MRPTYAAAGLAGAWNSFLVTPSGVRQPLIDVHGTALSATFYQVGTSSMLTLNSWLGVSLYSQSVTLVPGFAMSSNGTHLLLGAL